MDNATPEMKGPSGQQEHPPTNRMGEVVPPMKPGDKPTSPNAPTTQVPPSSNGTTTLPNKSTE
jgi:hypothetical protein